jgi:acetyl/propionyl-CoA carboxylase alpha subunit/acetyl-CoA carboxylase carboxyltransferase component
MTSSSTPAAHENDEGDRLFLIAESLATDFSLFAGRDNREIERHVEGLLSSEAIAEQCQELTGVDTDEYCNRTVAPAEAQDRLGARQVIAMLGGKIETERDEGALYAAEVTLQFAEGPRTIGILAQDRSVRNGVWGPEHHLIAAQIAEQWSRRNMPVATLMDTPGADAEEQANRNNQAHTISRLIGTMSNMDVPTIGIVLGLGYSGGAIPLATCNLLLSVRDGVFNTIQPKGLASIARKYDLSWQECAKLVGVSAYELCQQGNIDGVIDYSPSEQDVPPDKLRRAIITGIESIEQSTSEFVAANPYLVEHYGRIVARHLAPPEPVRKIESVSEFSFTNRSSTEFITVFGIAFRYLRYLSLRQRLKSTSVKQYGRLAEAEVPRGDLSERTEDERRRSFLSWLQDPEKLVYDESLSKCWRQFIDKRNAAGDSRSRVAQLIFGEPKQEYEQARTALVIAVTTYLYNRWKGEAAGNYKALLEHLRDPEAARLLLRGAHVSQPRALLTQLRSEDSILANYLRVHLSTGGRNLLSAAVLETRSEAYLAEHLAVELNLLMTLPASAAALVQEVIGAPPTAMAEGSTAQQGNAANMQAIRDVLHQRYPTHLASAHSSETVSPGDITILDVLLEPDLQEPFASACADLLIFDSLYDQLIASLNQIAAEANASRAISYETMGTLLERCLGMAADSLSRSLGMEAPARNEAMVAALRGKSVAWLALLRKHSEKRKFLKAVEEWKKTVHPQLSDTLLVIVTEVLERLIPSYDAAQGDPKRYDGHLNPSNIGRRKDFWNRLTIAYHDLQIEQELTAVKRENSYQPEAFIARYFESFDERNADLISADPVSFPGYRVSIEQALARGITPCGVVTGIGQFKGNDRLIRCGAMISNVGFQAGAFDMASAEKFCHLLVECARENLPVVCFVSSGGMQTKEGAGALFSMAVTNDRITRFVRDLGLPVIVFGFGDCTGGAQASFVTHPLVQNYYFSGTNMPFAGQIVVPANLPCEATLSNYLSVVPGAMRGLIQNPFHSDLDHRLQYIDPSMPIGKETAEDVVTRAAEGMFSGSPKVPAKEYLPPDPDSLYRPIKRTLIHARGCTAAKLIRIAQELDIDVVLVQSDPDMDSVAVDMLDDADRVVCIGGNTSDESYLNGLSVVRVAEHEQVDSLHPGIGFLSETSQFAELCRAHGINFIGPPVAAMEAMGNKSNAISTARRLNVPVVPGSHGILTDVQRASEVADDIGYPVLIKAVHGGGGKGIQVVEHPAQFYDLFRQVTVEARNAFGNGDVYLEKFVTSLRHIEVQLLRDTRGNTKILGLRDCSVQRNKQKVIEESGSTALPERLEQEVYRHTAAIAEDVAYVGAGTVEFIYDVRNDAVYFMEMNTRLQVEHPVTEKVSGINIVAEQFLIASGESIAHLEPEQNGYSIEVRVTAERLLQNADGKVSVLPDPGVVSRCDFPLNDDIDVIPAIASGKEVSPFYDSLVAQIIVHGSDRTQAAARMIEYLDTVSIEGVCTNIPLLKRVLADATFLGGRYDTGYLEEFFKKIDLPELIEEVQSAATLVGAGPNINALRIEGTEEIRVVAPTSGIFYLTPSPGEPDYVSIGERVTTNSVLCQLEAMKLFTPLRLASFNTESQAVYPDDQDYEIVRVNLASGQQVNAGDLLFVVKAMNPAEQTTAA